MAPSMRRCPRAAAAALALAPAVVFASVLKEQPGALESSLLETQEGNPWTSAPWTASVLDYNWPGWRQEPHTFDTTTDLGPAPDKLALSQAKPVGVETGGACFYHAMAYHLKGLGFKLTSGPVSDSEEEVRALRQFAASMLLELIPNSQDPAHPNELFGLDMWEEFESVSNWGQGSNVEALALSELFNVRVVLYTPEKDELGFLKKVPSQSAVKGQVGTIWLFQGKYGPGRKDGHYDALVRVGPVPESTEQADVQNLVKEVNDRLEIILLSLD